MDFATAMILGAILAIISMMATAIIKAGARRRQRRLEIQEEDQELKLVIKHMYPSVKTVSGNRPTTGTEWLQTGHMTMPAGHDAPDAAFHSINAMIDDSLSTHAPSRPDYGSDDGSCD